MSGFDPWSDTVIWAGLPVTAPMVMMPLKYWDEPGGNPPGTGSQNQALVAGKHTAAALAVLFGAARADSHQLPLPSGYTEIALFAAPVRFPVTPASSQSQLSLMFTPILIWYAAPPT